MCSVRVRYCRSREGRRRPGGSRRRIIRVVTQPSGPPGATGRDAGAGGLGRPRCGTVEGGVGLVRTGMLRRSAKMGRQGPDAGHGKSGPMYLSLALRVEGEAMQARPSTPTTRQTVSGTLPMTRRQSWPGGDGGRRIAWAGRRC